MVPSGPVVQCRHASAWAVPLIAPRFVEAVWFKSGHHRGGLIGELLVVVCLILCRGYIADGFEQAMVAEPGPLLPTNGSMPASASRSVYWMQTYCEPLSEWQPRLPSRSRCRAYRACSSASSTKSVRIELLTRQLTMLLATTSMR